MIKKLKSCNISDLYCNLELKKICKINKKIEIILNFNCSNNKIIIINFYLEK